MALLVVARFLLEGRWSFFSLCGLSLAFVVLYYFCKGILFFPAFLRTQSKTHRIILATITTISSLYLLIFWPGQIGDDLNLLTWLVNGAPSDWLSFSYSVVVLAMQFLSGICFSTSLLYLALYIYLICQILALTTWTWKNPFTYLFVTIMSFPISLFLISYQNRDSLYSLLMMVLLLSILHLHYKTSKFFQLSIYQLLAIAVLLSDMRQDGKYFLILVPLAVCLVQKFNKKKSIQFFAATFLAGFALFWIPGQFSSLHEFSSAYRSTALVNPLSHIVKNVGVENLTASQRNDIERYFSLDVLVKYHDPFDLYPYYAGGAKPGATEEDFQAFQSATFDLVKNYPLVFLDNRIGMFLRLYNFDRGSHFTSDTLREPFPENNVKAAEYYNLAPLPITDLYRETENFTGYLVHGLPYIFHLLLASCLIPLLTIGLLLFTYKKHPAIALCALILFARVVYFAVLAPAQYFKYVSSIWLGGWLLLLIFLNFVINKDKRIA